MAGLWTSHQVKFKVIRAPPVFCPRAEFKLKCTATPFTTTYLRPQDQRTDLFYSLRHGSIFNTTWEWAGFLFRSQNNPQGSSLRDGTTGQAPWGRSQTSQHLHPFSADGGLVTHLWGADGTPHDIGSRVCIDVLAARRQPIKTGTR